MSGSRSCSGFFLYIRSLERSGREPLLSTRLFRNRACNLALVSQNIQWLLLMGTAFVVSVYLREVRGYNAIKTGLIFTAATLGILFSSLAAKRLAQRYAQRTSIVAAFVVTLAGIVLLLGLVRASDEIFAFVPGLALVGLGLGAMLTPSVNVVQSSFPEELLTPHHPDRVMPALRGFASVEQWGRRTRTPPHGFSRSSGAAATTRSWEGRAAPPASTSSTEAEPSAGS